MSDSLSYSKRTKCQGCAALSLNGTYGCDLGVEIETDNVDGFEFRPRPLGKCWKPRTITQLDAVLKKNKKKAK